MLEIHIGTTEIIILGVAWMVFKFIFGITKWVVRQDDEDKKNQEAK